MTGSFPQMAHELESTFQRAKKTPQNMNPHAIISINVLGSPSKTIVEYRSI